MVVNRCFQLWLEENRESGANPERARHCVQLVVQITTCFLTGKVGLDVKL